MDLEFLAHNLTMLTQRFSQACLQAGRDPGAVRLLAVSKGQPVAALKEVLALGLVEFGENYAQELKAKKDSLTDLLPIGRPRFSFIGRLQSNKIPMIVQHAAEIQSIGSLDHAALVSRAVEKQGLAPYPVWLLVNIADEPSKGGFSPSSITKATQTIQSCYHNLDLRGVMAIPPPLTAQETSDPEPPTYYRELRHIADQVGHGLLSLGMTDDLEQAIRAGTNCIRIGTALFGPRLPKPS
jgi:pyridoxal phosphate enzyme (YggS family)